MARIPAAVAAVRLAVRRSLPADGLVLVACSGGADSLALAAAARFVGHAVGLVTVDHGLQDGSAARASGVADWARSVGFDPVEIATVAVAGRPGGPEAAARSARYEALSAVAATCGAAAVLLGHTRDDQAETVLLALARGAGPRGLAGMPYRKGIFLRPLLDVSRADTRKACAAQGLVPWDDPHNVDPAFARSRVRGAALPALVEALGPAVVANLARSAGQIAADSAALDRLARSALLSAYESNGLRISDLSEMVDAIRTRVLHAWAKELGASGAALSHRHVQALDALITDWHGQGPVHLPGGIRVARERGRLVRVP
ncbi:tRNA lysidine(34) synthetase TilS [Actinoplanes sp. KI2]|uniref:tRNA lysidine(34) synthetase TilS n=1 Tax=Actinoplanes sp. KI2 TaxID=2983315 RepID=UPI0021D5FE11|nr:tRNA lysidine(34) synthetase TilS [Actinoplanes sp. KI2]MCU7722371.1 tRNA lysidine(34) synthetase TilS [Actinoplanes sp. KI2]